MGVKSMTFKLTNAYSLCITISFELNDVSIYAINEKEVKDVGIIMLLLVTYYPNIISIFGILMSAGNIGA